MEISCVFDFFYLENKCDYHQNQVQNPKIIAEQTYVGKLSFIILISFFVSMKMFRNDSYDALI